MADKKNINELINGFQAVLENLKGAQNGTEGEQHRAMKEALSFNGYCCGSCIAVSSFCTPDQIPNKCKGGCTATSFAF